MQVFPGFEVNLKSLPGPLFGAAFEREAEEAILSFSTDTGETNKSKMIFKRSIISIDNESAVMGVKWSIYDPGRGSLFSVPVGAQDLSNFASYEY